MKTACESGSSVTVPADNRVWPSVPFSGVPANLVVRVEVPSSVNGPPTPAKAAVVVEDQIGAVVGIAILEDRNGIVRVVVRTADEGVRANHSP